MSPPPIRSPGATTLSFACAHSGDLNCNIPLNSGPFGCSSMNGTCYGGAYQPTGTPSYGWETLNGVYWQTWQEAQNTLDDPNNSGSDHAADVGTFGDVMEDCVNPMGTTKCSAFIITSQGVPGARVPPSGYICANSPVRGVGVGHHGCWNQAVALPVGEKVVGAHG
jgi:hypothetical protein